MVSMCNKDTENYFFKIKMMELFTINVDHTDELPSRKKGFRLSFKFKIVFLQTL